MINRIDLELSFCFHNKIELSEIYSYRIKELKGYDKGGFYLIKNVKTNMIYIGKSIDFMARLKQHTYNSSNKTFIDTELNNRILDFEFYLLLEYTTVGINFFNRKMETIIEQTFISIAQEKKYKLYNNNSKIYGHIQII